MSGGRIRSIRFKDGYTVDSLTNAVSGFGTHADPRSYNRYLPRNLDQFHIAAAYDGSGMMAKVIDIPALDMVREWRNWQADAKQIKALEAEERRLSLREKVRMAETYRGLGGGALIIITAGEHSSELKPEQIAKGGIVAINVVTRWQITGVDYIDEIADPNYGKPTYWRMGNSQTNIHPSRVICFRGDPVPPILPVSADERFWGRARVQRVLDAVQNVDTAQGSFASLITKVRNVIIGIPGLMDLVSDADGEAALRRRLSAMILGESMYNAMLRDAGDGTPGAGETIDHRQVNWAGIPDVMMAFATFLSAVSDIPATRLMGKSPDGQNSTGDSDTANWNRMVKAKQMLELQPCMDQFDPLLMASAGVVSTDGAEVWADWAPLDTPSEKEEADTFNVTMDAVAKLQATGTIPDEAFAKGVQNLMTERGWIPGLEGALAEIPEAERFGLSSEDDGTDDDPSTLQAGKEGDPVSAGGGTNAPARRAASDGGAPTGGSPFEDANKHHWGRGPRGGQFKSGPGGGGSPSDYVGRAIGGGHGQKQRPVGEVSPSAARLVKQRTGIDIVEKELRLDHSGIAHAWKNHGPDGKVHGAKSLTKGDLVRAATGLNQATDIRPAKSRGMNGPRFEVTYTNRRGTMTVIYETSSKAVYPMNAWWVK
ncbi:DUF1073 domain-containing protein [Novosphingobium sp. RL4]|uniref:phage portal protein n=1 Tax=Novosphingobium sp. RL4 TaxID=3109595 RepID=UPI002D76595A|nr:DUF1073 domain-containing protein [Novosphingobium sp. RL4]WRT91907.1 DUF1073 domain-containing protein [Novosphingobium sp. RL4]